MEGRRIFLIHGYKAKGVPPDHLTMLTSAVQDNIASTWLVPGINHIQSFDLYPTAYFSRVTAFFDKELTTGAAKRYPACLVVSVNKNLRVYSRQFSVS